MTDLASPNRPQSHDAAYPLTPATFARRVEILRGEGESIQAFENAWSNPDAYCACSGEKLCYYHGTSLREAIRAAEELAVECERIAAYLRSKLPKVAA